METKVRQGGPILLAPAGSPAAVTAVLGAGADAVYVGAGAWGRGGTRAGLSLEEIARAADDCRRAGAAIQVALNTVPAAGEWPAFLSLLGRLREAGIATVILNDPGAIALARREFPSLAICASVGTGALNPADVRFYRDLGADALVLPVAVGRDEVPALKAAGGLALEVFVWCRPEFIIQGKCLLAGYAGGGGEVPGGSCADPAGATLPGRAPGGTPSSAKRRGRCHYVCRALPVSRSPRTIEDDIPSWILAGVDAFKIEGRDLPPEALKALVARIRGKLDGAVGRTGPLSRSKGPSSAPSGSRSPSTTGRSPGRRPFPPPRGRPSRPRT